MVPPNHLRERAAAALQDQCAFIKKIQKEERVFDTREDFKRSIVDKLNAISRSYGVREYFSHNGFGLTYCSVICSCCEHKALLWFTFDGGRNTNT